MQFSLISTRVANPPVFTLTFNVTDGPPTNVTCTDGSNLFTIASVDLSCEVVNGPKSVTQVTVTVKMRQFKTRTITISNYKSNWLTYNVLMSCQLYQQYYQHGSFFKGLTLIHHLGLQLV